jgi:hypothetical protein
MTYNRQVRRGTIAVGVVIAVGTLLFVSGANADPPYSGGYGSPIGSYSPGGSAASTATQSIIQGARDDAGRDARTRSIVPREPRKLRRD